MNGEWNADHNGDNKWNIHGNASGKNAWNQIGRWWLISI